MVGFHCLRVLFLWVTGRAAARGWHRGSWESTVSPARVCPDAELNHLSSREPAHHPQQRHFVCVLCQEITFLKPVKYRLNPSGRSKFVSFPLVLMGLHNSSVSPEKKSFVSGTKSHNLQSWNN